MGGGRGDGDVGFNVTGARVFLLAAGWCWWWAGVSSVGVWCADGVVGVVRWWHLAGGLALGYHFMEFRHFPEIC